MNAIGYARVSTTEQERSGLGLAAQASEIERACELRGWQLLHLYTETVSGSKNAESLSAVLDAVRQESEGVLVVARLDRLTRSLAHLSDIIDRAEREGWSLVALDLGLDTSTDAGRLVARIMGAVAQWERERIRNRIKDAMREKAATGWKPGGPGIKPALELEIRELRDRLTLQQIADLLNERGEPTARGGTWRPATIARVVARS